MTPLCCLSDLANDSCQKEQKKKNINGDYLVTSSKPKANPYTLILIFKILTIKMSHIITGRPQRPFTRFPDQICY